MFCREYSQLYIIYYQLANVTLHISMYGDYTTKIDWGNAARLSRGNGAHIFILLNYSKVEYIFDFNIPIYLEYIFEFSILK